MGGVQHKQKACAGLDDQKRHGVGVIEVSGRGFAVRSVIVGVMYGNHIAVEWLPIYRIGIVPRVMENHGACGRTGITSTAEQDLEMLFVQRAYSFQAQRTASAQAFERRAGQYGHAVGVMERNTHLQWAGIAQANRNWRSSGKVEVETGTIAGLGLSKLLPPMEGSVIRRRHTQSAHLVEETLLGRFRIGRQWLEFVSVQVAL